MKTSSIVFLAATLLGYWTHGVIKVDGTVPNNTASKLPQ